MKLGAVLLTITLSLFISSQSDAGAQIGNLDMSLNLETNHLYVNSSTSNQTVYFNGTVNITKLPGIPVVVRFNGRTINPDLPMDVSPKELYFVDQTPQQFIISIVIPGSWDKGNAEGIVWANATYMKIPRTGTENSTGFDLSVVYPLFKPITNRTNATNQTQPNATQPTGVHYSTNTAMIDGLKKIFYNQVSVVIISVLVVIFITAGYSISRKRKSNRKPATAK